MYVDIFFFFFKQKTAYEMRISDWSSDVCSSDLHRRRLVGDRRRPRRPPTAVRSAYPRLRRAAARSSSCRCPARSEERRVGKECVVRVDLGGRRIIKKKKKKQLIEHIRRTAYEKYTTEYNKSKITIPPERT